MSMRVMVAWAGAGAVALLGACAQTTRVDPNPNSQEPLRAARASDDTAVRGYSSTITFKNDGSGEMIMAGGQRVRIAGFSGELRDGGTLGRLSTATQLQAVTLAPSGQVESMTFAPKSCWSVPKGEYRLTSLTIGPDGQLRAMEFAEPQHTK